MVDETILQYKILEKLGEGGMGEVYKARDTKLDRFVALKFLPSQMTATEEEKARFIQEAKAASAMNHPNVCTIYDIQENEGQLFIVMEFVEGKTLKDKKDSLSEKQILEIGIQVAEGLAAAHEKGIVHRDIKPENIMIRKDGIVQVMDFGLAKLYKDSNVSRLTKAGTTMGTMGYMSPEQVQGLDVDHRTDIFSLGVVLYELLSGEAPFKGVHETAIMYEIVNVDPPPVSSVKEGFDSQLDDIILECLEKDKDERCQSAKELAKDLRKIKKSSGHRRSRVFSVNTQAYQAQSTAINRSGVTTIKDIPVKSFFGSIFHNPNLAWSAAAILLIFFLVYLLLFNKPIGVSTGINSFAASINSPPGYKFAFAVNQREGAHFAVSPNGKMLAFVAQDSLGNSSLWVRQFNALSAQRLNGTDGAFYPFWSYDGKYIAYFADGNLKKILASGGPSITICRANDGRGGSWNKNNIIVFAPDQATGLFEVPASGGEPKEITKLDTLKNEQTHRWPCFLPDGEHFIFYSRVASNSSKDAIYISSLNGRGIKKLFTAHSNAVYADNNILYVQDKTLMAQPFDPNGLKLSGTAVPIEENVMFSQIYNCGIFSTSKNGVLIYQRGDAISGFRLSWFGRNGEQEKIFGKIDNYQDASLSPDGSKIALTILNNNTHNSDIWIYDINMKTSNRFTFVPGLNSSPIWSPDGKWIVFSSDRNNGKFGLYIKSANGAGNVIQLTRSGKPNLFAQGWLSSDKILGFTEQNFSTKFDVCYFEMPHFPDTADIKQVNILNSQFNELGPLFSPDGKWFLYATDETGLFQVYISPFPDISAGKWQVSTITPDINYASWSADGKGIYYTGGGKVIYVQVNPHGKELNINKSTVLFNIPYFGRSYLKGKTKDGNHFLFLAPVQSKEAPPLTIVTNWYKKLRKGKRE